jgi:hypothetical protein
MLLGCHPNCMRLLTCANNQWVPVVTIVQNGLEGSGSWLPKLQMRARFQEPQRPGREDGSQGQECLRAVTLAIS